MVELAIQPLAAKVKDLIRPKIEMMSYSRAIRAGQDAEK
jgi:hypothetical protein